MNKLLSFFLFAVFVAVLRDLNLVEAAGLVLALAVALVFPRFGDRFFRRSADAARRVARRPALAMIGVGAGVVAIRLLLLPWFPVPSPVITDEYSHLLLAETLTHARLTNPPHPMWQHFETIHVIFQPTYNSMYFPGQALFLAAGQAVFGSPWAGVLISTALMTAAIFWMLCSWFPNRWALLGAVLAGLRFGIHSYWVNSYWGGAAPAFAGALVLGASMRLYRKPQVRHAAVFGLGCFLLVNTRPFEGLAVIAPCLLLLAAAYLRAPSALRRPILLRAFVPVAIIGVLSGGWTAYYCWRVTGVPFRLPYQVNQAAYGWPATLPFFETRPIAHRHPEMAAYYRWEMEEHQKLVRPLTHVSANLADMVSLWSFYLGPSLTLFLLLAMSNRPWRRAGLLLAVVLLSLAAIGIEQSRYPHYISPATGAILGLVVLGMRSVAIGWRADGRKGLALVRWSVVALVLVVSLRATFLQGQSYRNRYSGYLSWCCSREGDLGRLDAEHYLRNEPGKHLVIVRYGAGHHWMDEWVHNAADIDASRIVWARDLGPHRNADLIRYYKDRAVWLATPPGSYALKPYLPEPAAVLTPR